MSTKILVVDDEQNILDIIKDNLQREGYEVITTTKGDNALALYEEHNPSLVLLDWMMPGLSGFDVCKILRTHSDVPIIFLTAKAAEIDKILGLELGADDYITKPFSMREVSARIKSQLRRYQTNKTYNYQSNDQILKFGDLTIDLVGYEVKRFGKIIPLTLREFQLLRCLATTPGQVYSREELLRKVWGYEYFGDVRTVDVTVRRTREKIEPDAVNNNYKYILTKRGVGYFFEKDANL